MRTMAALLLALLSWSLAQGQLNRITTPPYGYKKVRTLIDSIEKVEQEKDRASRQHDSDEIILYPPSTTPLPDEVYQTLSLQEKFTYHMIHPESYWQNCMALPSEWNNKEIPARLPMVYGELNWSLRQEKFFRDNRDSVMSYIKASCSLNRQLGLNDKTVLVIIDATEWIPFLQQLYRKKHDNEILTILLLLMKDHKYGPFLRSAMYSTLYHGSQLQSYRHFVDFNKTNEAFILREATDFYNGLRQ